MTPFELFFGLTSVILGLALAQLANSLQMLLRAGRRVDWSPEPILLSILVLLIIVSVWAGEWQSRAVASFTVGQCLMQVLKLLALFIAASAVLPEPKEGERIDLREHYLNSRAITFQDRLYPLHMAMFTDASPGPVKYALNKLRPSFPSDLRAPMTPPSDTSRKAVDAALAHAGMI